MATDLGPIACLITDAGLYHQDGGSSCWLPVGFALVIAGSPGGSQGCVRNGFPLQITGCLAGDLETFELQVGILDGPLQLNASVGQGSAGQLQLGLGDVDDEDQFGRFFRPAGQSFCWASMVREQNQ